MMDDRLLWNQTVDGPIEEAFWINSFTPDELQTCQGRHQLVVPENTPSSKLSNFHERRLLMDIVLAYTKDSFGGVVLENQPGTKYLAIEFCGPATYHGTPVIEIQYGISYEKERTAIFLRGEVVKNTVCPGQVMNAIQTHLLKTCMGRGLNDVASGLLLFERFLAPIQPMAPNIFALLRASGPEDFIPLPKGTFGVEFELSCVVRTWNEKL
jgi:hypothetical protein